MTVNDLAALATAIEAETRAEAAKLAAEATWRATWWATTDLLAAVPRASWGAARALYTERTGHTNDTADKRRLTGQRLPQTVREYGLPAPRVAQVAAEHLGADAAEADARAMAQLLAEAEADGLSLREFRLQLTGRSWTKAPENMTPTERVAVVQQALREAPEAVAEAVAKAPPATRQVVQQAAAEADLADHRAATERATPPRPSRANAAFAILRHSSAARAELDTAIRLYDAAQADPDPAVRMNAEGEAVLRRDLADLQAMLDLLLAVLNGAPADLSALDDLR